MISLINDILSKYNPNELSSVNFTVSQMDTEQDLATILKSLSSLKHDQSMVFVINPPVGYTTKKLNPKEIMTLEGTGYRKGMYPPRSGYISGPITVFEHEKMITLLTKIEALFD